MGVSATEVPAVTARSSSNVFEHVLLDCATVRFARIAFDAAAGVVTLRKTVYVPPLFAIEDFAARTPVGLLGDGALLFHTLVGDGMPVLDALQAAPSLL